MFTDDKLRIFEDFRVDHALPKYREPEEESEDSSEDSKVWRGGSKFVRGSQTINAPWDAELDVAQTTWLFENATLPFPWRWARRLKRFLLWLVTWATGGAGKRGRAITIQEFFSSVKNSAEELKIVTERAAGYEAAMAKAQESGQRALYESLVAGLAATRAEAQLVATGLTTYLEEARIVEFAKRAKKGLRLDWVANFVRTIPDEVLARKSRADALGIFDNYVVLHYDPTAKSWSETEAERRERKRDPILFGVIKGRRRLYFVGDWVDELCDLTLDQIADLLGADALGKIQ